MRCYSTSTRLLGHGASLTHKPRAKTLKTFVIFRSRCRRSLRPHSINRSLVTRLHAASLDDDLVGQNIRETTPKVGIIFSPGGFLVSYYLGVIECLTELGVLHDDTPISGTSAGALAGAFVVSGLSLHDCTDLTRQIQGRLLDSGYGWKVAKLLHETLNEVLPQDVHRRATDRIGIGVTIYAKNKGLSGKVMTQFSNRKEFIDAVVASCYIPYYLGPGLGIEWPDGSIYSDGMPTHFFPDFPADGNLTSDQTITVSAFPAANRRWFDARDVDISPDRRPRSEIPSVWKILWNGLVPLRMKEVDVYHRQGFRDTLLWAQQCTIVPLHKISSLSL